MNFENEADPSDNVTPLPTPWERQNMRLLGANVEYLGHFGEVDQTDFGPDPKQTTRNNTFDRYFIGILNQLKKDSPSSNTSGHLRLASRDGQIIPIETEPRVVDPSRFRKLVGFIFHH